MCRGINKNVYLRIILIGLARCDNFICVNCEYGFAGRVLSLRCAASCCCYAVTEFIARRKERTLITRSYFYCVAYTTRAVTPRKGTSSMQQTMRQEMKRDAVTVIQLYSYTVIVTVTVTVSNKAKRPPTATSTRSHTRREEAPRGQSQPACLTCVSQ